MQHCLRVRLCKYCSGDQVWQASNVKILLKSTGRREQGRGGSPQRRCLDRRVRGTADRKSRNALLR